MNPHESPEITLNSWLFAFCIFFAAGSCWLGSVGQWHQVGPATVAALFLVMCGPFVAVGKKATPDAESDGWRALTLMTSIAGGLIFSELSFIGPLFRTALHVPERGGDGAAGWFMIAAMVGVGGFVILLRRRVPHRVEGLNAQVALSAAAAAGASGVVGLILLMIFGAVMIWSVRGRAVDITGVLASATLPLLAVLAALSLLPNG